MIHRMLQHLYMQPYAVNLGFNAFWCMNDSWAKSRLHVHAHMYGLGDKYHLPALKKEAARRFSNDIRIPRNVKGETLALLSVVPVIYTTTPDSDRRLRNLVAPEIFQRYTIASKYFVDELDTALEFRQFARSIIVFRIVQYCRGGLSAATTSSSHTAKRLYARVRTSLGRVPNFSAKFPTGTREMILDGIQFLLILNAVFTISVVLLAVYLGPPKPPTVRTVDPTVNYLDLPQKRVTKIHYVY